jgi:26S proteasome regulatory subunit T5
VDLNDLRQGKSAVIKTTTRQTIFLPIIGLVDPAKLKPGDLIGLNKDSYLVLDTSLPNTTVKSKQWKSMRNEQKYTPTSAA